MEGLGRGGGGGGALAPHPNLTLHIVKFIKVFSDKPDNLR